ncbi:MAG: hypothetical protein PHG69_00605 [Candidatus Omnitrophica bacterium]|nr:hypothetical protein [Candidatus Omnitrophota bacterium]
MLIVKFNLIRKYIILVLFFAAIFYNQPSKFLYAEDRISIGYFDYSGMSKEDKKDEINLIYKYAKEAYRDNDLRTANVLFYQILELDPDHAGANRYIEYLIPKKISSDKYSKAKERQLILTKKEEAEFKKLNASIEKAKEQMDKMEKERVNKETLYRSQLNKIENDIKSEKNIEVNKTKDTKGKAKLKQKDKIKQEKKIQKKETRSILKEKKIKEQEPIKEEILFESPKLTEDSLKAADDTQREADKKLVNKLDAKEKTSWKMMEKELDKLQKKNVRLAKQKAQEAKKSRLKENKAREKAQRKENKANKVEAKKRMAEEKRINSPKYKKTQEKAEIARKKEEELSLKKEMIKQKKSQRIEKENVKKDKPAEKNIVKKEIVARPGEDKTAEILKRHKQKIESALQKKDRDSQIAALYDEGIYCYKVKSYDLAKEAFNKILELNPNHLKALDYTYIYIPEAESKP